jgi:hypothetical protein
MPVDRRLVLSSSFHNLSEDIGSSVRFRWATFSGADCNCRASSFFAFRFRHNFLSVLIPVLPRGNRDPLRPGDERFKKLSNGVKEPLPRGPCHQTSDRQYRSHANRRARGAISYIGLSLPNRIPQNTLAKRRTLDKFLALATRRRRSRC